MESTSKYFRVAVVGSDSIEYGTKVFEDKDNLFTMDTLYADFIYTYIANSNLKAMEDILTSRGFISYEMSSIPEHLLNKISVITCDKHFNHVRRQLSTEDKRIITEILSTNNSLERK